MKKDNESGGRGERNITVLVSIPDVLMLIGGTAQELSDYIFQDGGTVSLKGIREKVDLLNEAVDVLAELDEKERDKKNDKLC